MNNKPFTLLNKPFSPLNGVVVNLIWVNVLLYLILKIIGFFPGGIIATESLVFDPAKSYLLYFYTFISNIFVHEGFMHLLGNMLWLYFIGTIIENLIGEKHILRLFLLGGLSGTILYALVLQISGDSNMLLGASGGVAALLISSAIIAPTYSVFLFGIVQIELRWIVIVKIAYDIIALLLHANFGGNLAHLGGYLFGLAYITEVQGKWNFPNIKFPSKSTKPKRSAKVKINSTSSPSQQEVDAILDKISSGGYDSLTQKEKEKLFSASKNK
jgi:membrane associated rhomboid family serine protease